MTTTQKWILSFSALLLSAGLIFGGCKPKQDTNSGGSNGPAAGNPDDPTNVLNNANATIKELKAAIQKSQQETALLKKKLDAAIEDAIIAKLWWCFGLCCLAAVGCGAAAWFLPLFGAKALQGAAFSGAAAAICLILMKLVPHMWQIAWGVAIIIIVLIVIYFLRHAKGVSTAFAWTSEFAQQVGQDVSVAAKKEKFFVDKMAANPKAFSRDGLKALRDKALGINAKDKVVKPVKA